MEIFSQLIEIPDWEKKTQYWDRAFFFLFQCSLFLDNSAVFLALCLVCIQFRAEKWRENGTAFQTSKWPLLFSFWQTKQCPGGASWRVAFDWAIWQPPQIMKPWMKDFLASKHPTASPFLWNFHASVAARTNSWMRILSLSEKRRRLNK